MSKLNRLYNAEKILCYQMHQKWGDNLSKACLSIQWSLPPLLSSPNEEPGWPSSRCKKLVIYVKRSFS